MGSANQRPNDPQMIRDFMRWLLAQEVKPLYTHKVWRRELGTLAAEITEKMRATQPSEIQGLLDHVREENQ